MDTIEIKFKNCTYLIEQEQNLLWNVFVLSTDGDQQLGAFASPTLAFKSLLKNERISQD